MKFEPNKLWGLQFPTTKGFEYVGLQPQTVAVRYETPPVLYRHKPPGPYTVGEGAGATAPKRKFNLRFHVIIANYTYSSI